jgi:hypothetical protein
MKKNNKIPAGNPFKVPENYFAEVTGKIISSTSGEEIRKEKIGVYVRLRPYIAVAASVAVLALMSYTGLMIFNHNEKEALSLSGIRTEEFREAIVNEIDITTLEEKAASLDIPEVKVQVNNQDIIDYLVNDNIEINDIYEEL